MMDKRDIVEMLGEAYDKLSEASMKMSYVGRNSDLVMFREIQEIYEIRVTLRKISDRLEKEIDEERGGDDKENV